MWNAITSGAINLRKKRKRIKRDLYDIGEFFLGNKAQQPRNVPYSLTAGKEERAHRGSNQLIIS